MDSFVASQRVFVSIELGNTCIAKETASQPVKYFGISGKVFEMTKKINDKILPMMKGPIEIKKV